MLVFVNLVHRDDSKMGRDIDSNCIVLNRWNARWVLVLIGTLPFIGGIYGIWLLVAGEATATAGNLLQVSILFGVGFFLISATKNARITSANLYVEWRFFFVLSKQKTVPMAEFAKIVMSAESESHFGDVGSGGNRTVHYYRIMLVSKRPYNGHYYISGHRHFRRPKHNEECFSFVRQIHELTAKPVEYEGKALDDLRAAGLVIE